MSVRSSAISSVKESAQFIPCVQKDAVSAICMKAFRSFETLSIEQTWNKKLKKRENTVRLHLKQLSVPPASSASIVKRFCSSSVNVFRSKIASILFELFQINSSQRKTRKALSMCKPPPGSSFLHILWPKPVVYCCIYRHFNLIICCLSHYQQFLKIFIKSVSNL